MTTQEEIRSILDELRKVQQDIADQIHDDSESKLSKTQQAMEALAIKMINITKIMEDQSNTIDTLNNKINVLMTEKNIYLDVPNNSEESVEDEECIDDIDDEGEEENDEDEEENDEDEEEKNDDEEVEDDLEDEDEDEEMDLNWFVRIMMLMAIWAIIVGVQIV